MCDIVCNGIPSAFRDLRQAADGANGSRWHSGWGSPERSDCWNDVRQGELEYTRSPLIRWLSLGVLGCASGSTEKVPLNLIEVILAQGSKSKAVPRFLFWHRPPTDSAHLLLLLLGAIEWQFHLPARRPLPPMKP